MGFEISELAILGSIGAEEEGSGSSGERGVVLEAFGLDFVFVTRLGAMVGVVVCCCWDCRVFFCGLSCGWRWIKLKSPVSPT